MRLLRGVQARVLGAFAWQRSVSPPTSYLSIAELLAQNALVEAVPRIEQHLHGDAVIHLDVDRADRAHLVVVGDRGDRTLLRLEHVDAHARAVGQQRAAPAPRPER